MSCDREHRIKALEERMSEMEEWMYEGKLRMRTADEVKSYVEGFNYCYDLFCKYLKKYDKTEASERMWAIGQAVGATIVTEEGGRNVSESD